jgi:Flp pilus assembly protein TadG
MTYVPASDIPGSAAGGRVRRATTTVEFAVVSLFMFPMILGVFEIGRGLMVQHVLTAAACKGCRTAIIEGNDKTATTTAVQNVLTGAGISKTDATIATKVRDQDGDPANANAGDEITVIVSIGVDKISWVPNIKYLKGTLSAQYTLLRE